VSVTTMSTATASSRPTATAIATELGIIRVEPHPLLALYAFKTTLAAPLGELSTPPWLGALLSADAEAPLARSELLRKDVRDLLRHGGYKPTGRGKPASEYLVKAASGQPLNSINLVVDVCNVVSLHSGLPISVVDLGLAEPPLKVGIVGGDERYLFNAAGQEIRLAGLLCLHDASGPCANGVKDSQRTKTSSRTTQTLSLIWGPRAHEARTQEAGRWYRELLERADARTEDVSLASED
jgi:DNA/RNA-binding domain of Phe-tRNA-synthetase-like protein